MVAKLITLGYDGFEAGLDTLDDAITMLYGLSRLTEYAEDMHRWNILSKYVKSEVEKHNTYFATDEAFGDIPEFYIIRN